MQFGDSQLVTNEYLFMGEESKKVKRFRHPQQHCNFATFLFQNKRTSAASFSYVSQHSHRRMDRRGYPRGRAVGLSESSLRKRDPRNYFKPRARRLQPTVFVWRNHEEALCPAGTTSL